MSLCVLDASYTCQWLFRDEASDDSGAALEAIAREGACVPVLWTSELVNVLGMAERRGRITAQAVERALHLLTSLPLEVDRSPPMASARTVLELMRRHRLTAYDATYLELALRTSLPLATKDRQLAAAALLGDVPLYTAGR